MAKLDVVVIGAGLSGLCSAKYALQSGHSVTVYEQTSNVGGTWIYTDATGTDEYGIDIHTSMYYGLHTNLPKEIMGFSDYPMPATIRESYVGSQDVLHYLEDYAEHFNVVDKIKFRHQVIRVRPVQETKWEIIVKDVLLDRIATHIYDAIFICNGHSSVPSYPKLYPGSNLFQGRQKHSHDYRRAEEYEGKKVLIIGGGNSGVDLTYFISGTAKCVYFSHHTHNLDHIYPSNVVRFGAVKELTETAAIFADGSQHAVDEIVYCTGYKFTFPFLNAECGLCVDENYIRPLFKHMININYPTMAIIRLPFPAVSPQMVDIQVRFTMKFLNGEKSLPSEADMKADCERYAEVRRALGFPKRKLHSLAGTLQQAYYDDLSAFADIENVRGIYMKIFKDSFMRRTSSPSEFRSDLYRIIDSENFERTSLGGA